MACNLKISTSPTVDFEGVAGASVTLKVTSQDADAEIIHVRYADDDFSNPPFQFTLKPGKNKLVVLAEASEAGALLELREDCGGSDQVLTTFHYDPSNPARGYTIKG